jgi:hypothetical protein
MRPDLAQQEPARLPIGDEQAGAAQNWFSFLGKRPGYIPFSTPSPIFMCAAC